jgi:hypothetical protein
MGKRRFKPLPGRRPCEICGEPDCKIHYFTAVPLPRIMYLCDKHYERVKEEAHKFVHKLLHTKLRLTWQIVENAIQQILSGEESP